LIIQSQHEEEIKTNQTTHLPEERSLEDNTLQRNGNANQG